MRLKRLLTLMNELKYYDNIKINAVRRKEEEIKEGDAYFSFKPVTPNDYLRLKQRGAHFIIGETPLLKHDYLPVLSVKKSYQTMLFNLNKHKLKNKILIGITGTNGKTSVASLIYGFLKNDAIYYGSNGIYGKSYVDMKTTTPSMEEFFDNLGNEKYVIVELSSIAFYEYRMFMIPFDYIVLTNIEEDHLDYHKAIADYYYTKLLTLSSSPNATVLISDQIVDDKIYRLNKKTYRYGYKSNLFSIRKDLNSIYLKDNKEEIKITPQLPGSHNLENILAALSVLYLMKYKLKQLEGYFNQDLKIKGRSIIIPYKEKRIIIDYPHTESAYYKTLTAYNTLKEKTLVILGAGGERQESKREKYTKLVSLYASYAILTNDNPRNEDEMKIINDLEKGLTIPYEIILNRKEAIKKAISLNYEVIFILGKGEENGIIIKDKIIPHNDLEEVLSIIND